MKYYGYRGTPQYLLVPFDVDTTVKNTTGVGRSL